MIMKIFRIFALLILMSCQDVTIPNHQCVLMTFSDALPVQFWQTGCNTYNATVPAGVHEKCWCAPWQCDDEIRIQFQENVSPDVDYSLLIKDEDGAYFTDLDFTEVEIGVHSVYFSPETEGICDSLISLEIVEKDSIVRLLPPNTDWVDDGATLGKGASNIAYTGLTTTDGAKKVKGYQLASLPAGTIVAFDVSVVISGTYTFNNSVPLDGIKIDFFTSNDGNSSLSTNLTEDAYTFKTNGTYSIRVIIQVDSDSDRLYVSFDELNMLSGSADITLTLTDVSNPIYAGTVLAKSDCLDVRLSHEDDQPTQLFEYSNARNFAGLVYSAISPDASFNIRVPCRFFHEVFPEEDEAIELTSSVITTSGQIKSQKLLEVAHAPYYFHKKLQLILKHQTLSVGGVNYQKEEKYEVIQGNKRWPLKQATCLLTEKNSVLRNVI